MCFLVLPKNEEHARQRQASSAGARIASSGPWMARVPHQDRMSSAGRQQSRGRRIGVAEAGDAGARSRERRRMDRRSAMAGEVARPDPGAMTDADGGMPGCWMTSATQSGKPSLACRGRLEAIPPPPVVPDYGLPFSGSTHDCVQRDVAHAPAARMPGCCAHRDRYSRAMKSRAIPHFLAADAGWRWWPLCRRRTARSSSKEITA